MKILLVGNHTCGNRGDGAILRGLLDSLRKDENNIQVDILSRYAVSSEYLLGESIIQDVLYSSRTKNSGGLFRKFQNKIKNSLLPQVLLSHARGKGILRYYPLPPQVNQFIRQLHDYDAVIQVGGSFFVDLYGSGQFEHILCSVIAKKPIYLLGHSVGPFENKSFREIAKYAFEQANEIVLREEVSRNLMLKDSFNMKNVIMGVDTAFLVRTDICPNDYMVQHWLNVINQNKTVAITVRRLAPFDKRLGVTQDEYEQSIADVIDHLISLGYQVIAFSTCTGIESYHNDDRMVALSISKKVKKSSSFYIVMDELNDVQLGSLLSQCEFTIGTRLHSAIISINFGTPAIAINYEHKSLGVMQGLKMDGLSASIKDLISGNIKTHIDYLISNYDTINFELQSKVQETREIGHEIVSKIVKSIG
ncbi:TPA: colanic acid biosynthesis pyruvyl transferase WcaK [Klebsiella variicola subsp. variicola]|nr:colanic acid biosynthesis pyruvyl transferase WcaK [Klebsiella variicola subsp. variicola]HCI4624959.1 colanic acid biosynthesis pyruvyl transferase WcaK [Klebsiella variicola subsp. variicola]HCI6659071.1 colanic acid biosynthesis pyruvyl transferase WcaK [Klebsiella variicola subsp. variicola]